MDPASAADLVKDADVEDIFFRYAAYQHRTPVELGVEIEAIAYLEAVGVARLIADALPDDSISLVFLRKPCLSGRIKSEVCIGKFLARPPSCSEGCRPELHSRKGLVVLNKPANQQDEEHCHDRDDKQATHG